MKHLIVEIDSATSAAILAPNGIATPYTAISALEVEGGRITKNLQEAESGLSACLVEPTGPQTVLRYTVEEAPAGALYPEAAFAFRENQYTRAASDLAEASYSIAQRAGGGHAGIEALVAEAQSRFSYAHPKHRFNDGTDAVPYLSCGTTSGSCVDINTYLVASLRSAGYEAAYIYGYFFPEERGGMTDDGHCWVVTRHEGEVLEWDIAHHIKAELGTTRAGLNPRPGQRVAISHSMGHRYSALGYPSLIKILGEPMGFSSTVEPLDLKISVRLHPW